MTEYQLIVTLQVFRLHVEKTKTFLKYIRGIAVVIKVRLH